MTSAPDPIASSPAAPEPAAQPAPGASMSYVYAVGRDERALRDAAAERPGGVALRVVTAHGLAALVADVPAEQFDERGLRAQLGDLDRLEAVARRHHDVVASAWEHATVLPMRLATVYFDDERAAGMLQEREEEFTSMLDWLTGQVEWGVKLYVDVRAARDTQPSPRPGTSSGRAYLQARRAARRGAAEAHGAAEDAARRISQEAASWASASAAHRPQQGDLATGPGENIVNWAFLVPAEHGERFRRAVQDAAGVVPGVRLEITGPWAPYSFATPDDSGRAQGGP
ncbi:GvpL/GvpF family gas vesicle protein [Streptantibioticus parmotrematis]|uniref:GvpL/GvpF family gas vesicle protein n=1 Tax=Streptantibioticus parmotrematis TaxID=2873249 RepID=UPI0033EB6635